MKAFLLVLLVSVALVGGYPAGKKKERKPGRRMGKNFQFEDWALPPGSWDKKPHEREEQEMEEGHENEDPMMPHVRWCVTSPCEMKKCERMTTEFNYMVNPKIHWSCVMARCKKTCMEKIERGYADIMTAEGEEIYTAGKMFDLMPVMYEKQDHSSVPNYDTKFAKYEQPDGSLKHYSIALVKKTNTEVNIFQDMRQRKSCHGGVDMTATFKSPVCSLIHAGVIPRVGNMYECAGEFFKESCVPGVQHDKFNKNMTNPESLCKLCKGKEDDDFCETLSDKEPYYGFMGTLKCLRESQGDVGFFHTHDVMMNYGALSQEFDIVCRNKKLPLTWDNVVKHDCHVTEEYPQVVMVSTDKPTDWVTTCTSALADASKRFSSKDARNAFSLFDSTPYCAMKNDEDEDGDHDEENDNDDEIKWGIKKMKNEDLIFHDHSATLEHVPQDRMTYKTFLDGDTINKWKTCEQLEPKPRAFICVVGNEEMTKCKNMITNFMTIQEVKKISWGCVEASCKRECVKMIHQGMVDIVDLNATEMFMAGLDHNLSPFMGENYKGKKPWTESITVGVMLKDSTDLTEDMRGWSMCGGGIDKISGFLHPMGWLLANGTITRSTSPLKSIGHYFGGSCVPGMNTLDLTKHPLLSRTLDWKDLLKDKDLKWEGWYQTPLWRKWQEKQTGASDVYEPMHEMTDFESEKFQMMLKKMASDDPRVHAYHTPEIHDIIMKAKTNFSWSNYDGLEDFYNVDVPTWKMIGWIWEKPGDWDEKEWSMFMMWAQPRWDQKEDWGSYMNTWTAEDWDTFKKWINSEYKDYLTEHMDIHQDIFIRLSLLCSRFHWLMTQWKNLQWDNLDIKHCRERMCQTCAGQGEYKCSMDTSTEDYYGYRGALKCLKQDDGDIAFMDAYQLEDAITKNGFKRDDFTLMCPDGSTVDYTGPESFEECHFGYVPSHALVTCNMHDGVWRWKVTKALLEAQKMLTGQNSFNMFKDGIFGSNCESLTPIPFVNQTYQVWLGPMFLRAMEGLMQPPVKPMKWDEEHDDEMYMEDDVEDRPPCDECEDGDDMCLENCWPVEEEEDTRPGKDKKKPREHGHGKMKHMKKGSKKMMKMGGRGGRNKMSKKMGMMKYRQKMMLWKPKGQRMHQMMGRKHMGSMKHGMGSMKYGKGPMMHGKKPMKYGMGPNKYGTGPMMSGTGPIKRGMKYGMESMMMWHKKYMGSTKYGMDRMGPMMHRMMDKTNMGPMMGMMMKNKMMGHPMMKDNMMHHQMMGNHHMETGPMMKSHRSLRGEFYTNVIFARGGTCNAVIHDLTCFGKQMNIKMQAGRVGKTMISVPMCPRPTIMKKTTAQFTCDTGASFLDAIMLPVKCSYVPCNRGFWLPKWSEDKFWDGDNAYPGDYWGTKDWWSFDKRDENNNWFLIDRSKNKVDKSERIGNRRGGLKWRGQKWSRM